MERICQKLLSLKGWSLDTELPATSRYILILYPHTSNWDFIYGMLAKGALGVPFRWMGKKEMFHWPLRTLYQAMGGIPVDRSNPQGLLDAIQTQYEQESDLVIALTPEGTRSFRPYWKSGFYRLAQQANLPIALGYIDYRHKRLGIGPLIQISGDQNSDLTAIRDFYQHVHGKYPEKSAPIKLDNH